MKYRLTSQSTGARATHAYLAAASLVSLVMLICLRLLMPDQSPPMPTQPDALKQEIEPVVARADKPPVPPAQQNASEEDEAESDAASQAHARTIELFALDENGEPQSKGRVAPGELSTVALAEHIAAISQQPSVKNVEQLIDLLPHTLRYDVQDGRVVCPYSMILTTLSRWTPIDGSNVYDAYGRLKRDPDRHFALLRAHGSSARHFHRQWIRSVGAAVEDVEYCQQWLARRRGSLQMGALAWWREVKPPGASGGPDRPTVTWPREVEYMLIGEIIFDPQFDNCKMPPRPDTNRPMPH